MTHSYTLNKTRRALAEGLEFDAEDLSNSNEDLAVFAELFCALKFSPKLLSKPTLNKDETKANRRKAWREYRADQAENAADAQQLVIGYVLAKLYDHGRGSFGISRDHWKAKKYDRQRDLPKNTNWRTEYVYSRFSWFNSIRLFLLRLNRLLRVFDNGRDSYTFLGDVVAQFLKTASDAVTKNINTIANVAGLSYILELIFDLGVVFRTTFLATKKERKKTPSWTTRFINALKKDDRMPRMANAAVWFGVNFTCFFVTGGAAAVLNLVLFGFDVLNDSYKAYRDMSKNNRFFAKITEKIAQLRELIRDESDPSYKQNKQQLRKYQCIEKRLTEHMRSVRNKRLYAVFMTCVLFTGMVFVLFYPPASSAYLAGCFIAMSASVFAGFGKKIFETLIATAPKPTIIQPTQLEPLLPIETTTELTVKQKTTGPQSLPSLTKIDLPVDPSKLPIMLSDTNNPLLTLTQSQPLISSFPPSPTVSLQNGRSFASSVASSLASTPSSFQPSNTSTPSTATSTPSSFQPDASLRPSFEASQFIRFDEDLEARTGASKTFSPQLFEGLKHNSLFGDRASPARPRAATPNSIVQKPGLASSLGFHQHNKSMPNFSPLSDIVESPRSAGSFLNPQVV